MSSSPPPAESNEGRAICPICFEDVSPAADHLLSISVCGHVFHAPCLHQWQEYCPGGKRCSCPVCKQSYLPGDVTQLFFQSVGAPFYSQKNQSGAEYDTFGEEVEKLHGKMSTLNSALDAQTKLVDQLRSEVLAWKNRAQREEELRKECQKENGIITHLLERKEADLRKSSDDCLRLRESSSCLAKELATLKLAVDVNLGEEEVAKLVAVGHGTTADAIDVLQRSLLLRNKCYKELMIQCNSLGRAETSALKKLNRAQEKIKLLKARVLEMERATEKKTSQKLRGLKSLRKKSSESALGRIFDGVSTPVHLQCDSMEVQPDDSAASPICHLVLPGKNDIIVKSNHKLHDNRHQLIEHTINSTKIDENTRASNITIGASVIEDSEVDEDNNYCPSVRCSEKAMQDQSHIYFESTRSSHRWSKNPKINLPKSCGQLIAFGADGRGGTVKVLRDPRKFPQESRARSFLLKQNKRKKTGVRRPYHEQALTTQPIGGIEHYFGKSRT